MEIYTVEVGWGGPINPKMTIRKDGIVIYTIKQKYVFIGHKREVFDSNNKLLLKTRIYDYLIKYWFHIDYQCLPKPIEVVKGKNQFLIKCEGSTFYSDHKLFKKPAYFLKRADSNTYGQTIGYVKLPTLIIGYFSFEIGFEDELELNLYSLLAFLITTYTYERHLRIY